MKSIKKILLSTAIFSSFFAISTDYYALVIEQEYNIVEVSEPPVPVIENVCHVNFMNIERGGNYGGVLAQFSIDTGDGNYEWGERLSSEPLEGLFENGRITATNRYPNSSQYYIAAAIDPHPGEWGVWLGSGVEAEVRIELYNPTPIASISYADMWSSGGKRSSENYTVELRDCSDNLLQSKYVDGHLSVSSLVAETLQMAD